VSSNEDDKVGGGSDTVMGPRPQDPKSFARTAASPKPLADLVPGAHIDTSQATVGAPSPGAQPAPTEQNAPTGLPQRGQVIADKYEILKKIGEGGFGAVYIAHQKLVDRKVVIKALRRELTANPDMVQRFLVEARAASKVMHPNVVTIHDFGYTDEDMGYLVMEFIEGRELDDVLKQETKLEWPRALKITRSIAEALAEAHSHDIVHRDMKPQNVMLTRAGQDTDYVKVLDFGIAKLRESEKPRLTKTGMVMGTPSFMAPEQLEGKDVGPAADTYALGCMLSFMLTGQLPFEAPTMTALVVKHLMEEPPVPSQRVPDAAIPAAVDALVTECMAKAPEQRPTMLALIERIDRLMAGGAGAAPAHLVTAPAHASKVEDLLPPPAAGAGKKKSFPMAIVAGVVIGLGAVAAIIATSGGDSGSTPNSGAVVERPAAVTQPDATTTQPAPKKKPDATVGVGPTPDAASSAVAKPAPKPALPKLDPGAGNGFRLDGIPVTVKPR